MSALRRHRARRTVQVACAAIALGLAACGGDGANEADGAAADTASESTPPVVLDVAPEPRPAGSAPPGMVWIGGGTFTMGSDADLAWPTEHPAHRVTVGGFWMDATEVTNARFAAFVDATGYVTDAERPVDRAELVAAGVPAELITEADLLPSALVFETRADAVHAGRVEDFDFTQVWHIRPGADWRHPEGPWSSIEDRMDHPVVHVTYADALAFCEWAGCRLPTEPEWECAARGGLESATYSWGDEDVLDPVPRANVWQGTFPNDNSLADGFARTAPVGSFAPNGFGLYDMGGNVWEWTADWFRSDMNARRASEAARGPVVDPVGPSEPWNANSPSERGRVTKGGSFLCDTAQCFNYRPSSSMASEATTPLCHTGFRCVRDPR
jgi:formylglycine-generating enzyme